MKYLRAASPEAGPAVVERGEDVEGDGEDLQAEEDDDQVVGRPHQHRSRRRHQGENVELGAVDPLPPEVAVGHQRGEEHGGRHQHGDQHAEAVHDDGVRDVGVRRRGPGRRTTARWRCPNAPPEITTLPMVLTRTRSGRLTSEATASRTTAPPPMMMIGRMLR